MSTVMIPGSLINEMHLSAHTQENVLQREAVYVKRSIVLTPYVLIKNSLVQKPQMLCVTKSFNTCVCYIYTIVI